MSVTEIQPANITYELNVLSGLLSKRILKLRRQIKPKYFEDRAQAELVAFCTKFFSETKTAPTKEVIIDSFRDKYADMQQEIEFLLKKLNPEIEDAMFEHSLKEFLNAYKVRLLEEMRRDMADIYNRGVDKTLGDVNTALNDVKSVDNSVQNIYYTDSEEDNKDFMDRLLDPDSEEEGIPTSNPLINEVTGGMKKKALWIVAGAPGECKSTQLLNWAYDCLMQHKNTFYCTVEMSEEDVKRNLYALHVFKKYDYIIDTQKIRNKRSLTDKDKEHLQKAKSDFEQLKGRLIVFELPIKYSFSNLESKLIEENEKRPVDAVFIDYLLLLKPDEKRLQKHEEDEQMFKDAKQLANTFDDGNGIFVCTAHQINTEGIKRARKRGHYEFEDFAKTAEARNSPDFAVSNWIDGTLREQNEIKQKIHKNRFGETPANTWTCPTVLACSVINPPMVFDDAIPDNLKLD